MSFGFGYETNITGIGAPSNFHVIKESEIITLSQAKAIKSYFAIPDFTNIAEFFLHFPKMREIIPGCGTLHPLVCRPDVDVCSRPDICSEFSLDIQRVPAQSGGGLIECGESASKDAVSICPAVAC